MNASALPIWRLLGWSAAGLLLLIPFVAGLLTDEVSWSGADFAMAAALLLTVGLALESAFRVMRPPAARAATALSLVSVLLLVWFSLGVGIIGADGDPANLMYGAVLVVGLVGTLLVRARPPGMSRVLLAMAGAQTIIALVAIAGGMGQPYSGPLELALLNGGFVALFGSAAWLYRRSSAAPADAP